MEYHVVVDPEVSRSVGAAVGHLRTLLVRVFNHLHDDLRYRAHLYRQQRDPEDREHWFRYALTLLHEDTWHTFSFRVDDVRATGYLFVIGVTYVSGPAI